MGKRGPALKFVVRLTPEERTQLEGMIRRMRPWPTAIAASSPSSIVPSHELVIVSRGLDCGQQGFDPWGLAWEVIKAIN